MRAVLVALVALAIGCAHAPAPVPSGGAPELVRVASSSPIVAIHVVFDSGSSDDPASLAGLASLTATAMREGGSERLPPAALRRALLPMAAELEVTVDREYVSFVGRVHRDHADDLLAVLREILVAPAFPQATLERLRERETSDIELGLLGTEDEALAEEVLYASVFGDHPYSHPTMGTRGGLARITRADLIAHRARAFCRSRMRVGIAGDVPEGFAARVSAALSEVPEASCAPVRGLAPAPPSERRRVVLVEAEETAAVPIRVAIPHEVTRAHPDYVALSVAAAYLGLHGQFLGRLMQEVREARGLNYGDYVYSEPYSSIPGLRGPGPGHLLSHPHFDAWIRPVQPESAHFVLRLVLREIDRLVDEGIAEADFERVRAFLLRTLPLSTEVDESRLGYRLDQRAARAALPWDEQMREGLATLTVDDVNRAVRAHLDRRGLRAVLVVPDGAAFREALLRDAPSPPTYDHEVPESVREADRAIERYPLGLRPEDVVVESADSLFR
ncbi:MAG: pitrilysin family protein [Polyangiales bacterium]